MFKWLKRLLPRRGPKVISPEEGKKRWDAMMEKVEMSLKRKGK